MAEDPETAKRESADKWISEIMETILRQANTQEYVDRIIIDLDDDTAKGREKMNWRKLR